MIRPDTVRAIRERIAPHPAPVLSLYLDVNPANPANVRKAPARKARESLRELDLPGDYAEAVVRKLELEHVIPEGRTLIVFAGEDPDELFATYYVQAELPLLELTDGALAHWGEPFVAPLLFAIDQAERYGLVFVSRDRVRCFESFLGEAEELLDLEREDETGDWRPIREARRSPAVTGAVAARGGAGTDRFDDRMEEAAARFFRGAVGPVEEFVREEQVDRLILIGPVEAVAAFEQVLPPVLSEKVVERLPAPANPDMPANEWQRLVADTIDRAEAEHEDALLDQVRERGVWGPSETLTLLQEHRLSVLVVPWRPEGNVYRAEPSGRVATTVAELEVLYPEDEYRLVPLLEALPALVERAGTKLEFVDGPRGERLLEEFAGLAGLRRF